jgi:hypothetical protein
MGYLVRSVQWQATWSLCEATTTSFRQFFKFILHRLYRFHISIQRISFSVVQEARRAAGQTYVSSPIEPSGSETSKSINTYPRADTVGDDSFIRHHSLSDHSDFSKDGNSTVLVRGYQP